MYFLNKISIHLFWFLYFWGDGVVVVCMGLLRTCGGTEIGFWYSKIGQKVAVERVCELFVKS